jgi:ABC-type tungstate transport system permease subunit
MRPGMRRRNAGRRGNAARRGIPASFPRHAQTPALRKRAGDKITELFMRGLPFFLAAAFLFLPSSAPAAETMTVVTTTGVQRSGLPGYIKPLVLEEANIELRWLFAEPGDIAGYAKNCGADALLAPERSAEEASVVDRRRIMLLTEGDARARYSAMTVNPENCPKVRAELAGRFENWLTGTAAQVRIADFAPKSGQRFLPDAEAPVRRCDCGPENR